MKGKNRRNQQSGQTTLELALLTPILAAFFFAIVQIIILLESSIVTQYGAFTAARSYQVYGRRTLESIQYPHTRSEPYTNDRQTIAEAAAEKVIFESLLWEHRRIDVDGGASSLDRHYLDGNDASENGVSAESSQGAVRVNFRKGHGVEVTYCAPIRFPGAEAFFKLAKKEHPCKSGRTGKSYDGIALIKRAEFGVEPEVEP